jgi:enamine deaminase RidA (YjgF/YER057c/UK114 family)
MHEKRLVELGLTLPAAAVPAFNYVPVTLYNSLAWVSGQLPKVGEDVLVTGKVGSDVSLEVARGEARICILQGLACLRQALGTLDRVERVLKVVGFVASAPGSELLVEVFGDAGRHARSAVGVAELPRNACVEIELVIACKA